MVVSGAKTKYAMSTKPARKSHHPTHPPWIEMITECIATTPDGTRHGVSRPAIKKFVDSKYHLPMNAAATNQLNRAIAHGMHSGNFVLPKGPSGKVKLAPQRAGEITKENKKPLVVPKSTRRKERPLFAEEHHVTAVPATKKYRSKAKKSAHVRDTYSGEKGTSPGHHHDAGWHQSGG
ncbi:hypothetical protein JVU11DRAFT_522 [Chiua virens]|nr:hypothetical protein JVU11DRAFT_522 [Chiua virens]